MDRLGTLVKHESSYNQHPPKTCFIVDASVVRIITSVDNTLFYHSNVGMFPFAIERLQMADSTHNLMMPSETSQNATKVREIGRKVS